MVTLRQVALFTLPCRQSTSPCTVALTLAVHPRETNSSAERSCLLLHATYISLPVLLYLVRLLVLLLPLLLLRFTHSVLNFQL